MNCSNLFSKKKEKKMFFFFSVNIHIRSYGFEGAVVRGWMMKSNSTGEWILIKITFYSLLFKLLTEIHFLFALLPEVHGKTSDTNCTSKWETHVHSNVLIFLDLFLLFEHFPHGNCSALMCSSRHGKKCLLVFSLSEFIDHLFASMYKLCAPINDISDMLVFIKLSYSAYMHNAQHSCWVYV